jgi:cell division protein FtsL
MRFIVILVVIIFVFISHRYTVLQRMADIERLQKELKDAKYESLTISSSLTEISRQTQIEKAVKDAGLDLSISTDPIYRIEKSDSKEKK